MNLKLVMRVVLGVIAVLLAIMCYRSITGPIEFNDTKDARERDIIAKLIDIRKAEIEYKNQNGVYTASFDTLIDFIRNGKMKQVKKEGDLTDDQLKNGLTEKKALAIVKSGNQAEIQKWGLQGFSRDTSYVNVLEALFEGKYDAKTIEEIQYIPHSNPKTAFELKKGESESNGIKLPLFEATAAYETYLSDLDKQELANLKSAQEDLGRYPGLKVGDASEPNNNIGNWER